MGPRVTRGNIVGNCVPELTLQLPFAPLGEPCFTRCTGWGPRQRCTLLAGARGKSKKKKNREFLPLPRALPWADSRRPFRAPGKREVYPRPAIHDREVVHGLPGRAQVKPGTCRNLPSAICHLSSRGAICDLSFVIAKRRFAPLGEPWFTMCTEWGPRQRVLPHGNHKLLPSGSHASQGAPGGGRDSGSFRTAITICSPRGAMLHKVHRVGAATAGPSARQSQVAPLGEPWFTMCTRWGPRQRALPHGNHKLLPSGSHASQGAPGGGRDSGVRCSPALAGRAKRKKIANSCRHPGPCPGQTAVAPSGLRAHASAPVCSPRGAMVHDVHQVGAATAVRGQRGTQHGGLLSRPSCVMRVT